MIKLKDLLKEDDQPINLDRHGSSMGRPEDIRFDKPEDYNTHMGFNAALSDDLEVPMVQRNAVKELLRQGYKVSGHSKMPDNPKHIEILMLFRKGSRTQYADVQPDGKVM